MSQQLTILVVDDHKIFRQGIIASLKSVFENCTIIEAASGKECISILETWNPDVIFMDIRMPGMDGMETSRHILQQDSTKKIIGLSMHDKDALAIKMFSTGVAGYLLKTDDTNDFADAVETVLTGGFYMSKNVAKTAV